MVQLWSLVRWAGGTRHRHRSKVTDQWLKVNQDIPDNGSHVQWAVWWWVYTDAMWDECMMGWNEQLGAYNIYADEWMTVGRVLYQVIVVCLRADFWQYGFHFLQTSLYLVGTACLGLIDQQKDLVVSVVVLTEKESCLFKDLSSTV